MKILIALTLPLLPVCATPGALLQDQAAEPAGEAASEQEEPALGSSLLAGLALRGIGPALMSGRISDLAIHPENPNVWYVAVGSGGVWKTVNAGTTWSSLFDGQGSYSIGCVTLDPNDPDVLWVGSGEDVGGRHVGFGDGVYRSRDGGASFENLGLADSQHIAEVLIDPRDSNVVYVASQGPLWSPGGERGLFKSVDGGASWENVLSAGEWTGVTAVVMDPRDPDVLYAATHQRHRTVAALLNGGPESGLHKSVDAGATWRELSSGLPGEDMGKIGLALSPQNPDVIYATIELADKQGGTYVSVDRGESWEKRSDYMSGGTGPHYYQELWADPHREGTLYHANVRLGRSEDGGRTWGTVANENKHVDNHAVAFHPSDPNFLLVGCDGGLYRSYDRGETWSYTANLPLTQYYKLDVDYDWPEYHVVGGTQDNNTQYGPVRTLSENGIANRDWRITIGGDGHDNAIDPQNPDILYCESQQGYIRRFDRRTGESVDIRPAPASGEEDLHFNWDSPILISPHANERVYFASNRLYRSEDRGDSWTALSGDLSRGLDRLTLPIMGRVWSVDGLWDLYAMSKYGNVTSISESPVTEGLLYVGTDDGLIQVSEDGGANWRREESFANVPAGAFVNDVKADRFDADTVYAAFDDHKNGDFTPYLAVSRDRGRSWTSLASDLPERHLVWRIEQDHVRPELLFLGTEFGLFTSIDGGERWIALEGNAPTIPFRDLAIQRRENDLVAASFGRSFWVLDDYTPLRELSSELVEDSEFHLFAVRDALLYMQDDVLGGEKGSQGDGYYNAPNPPHGATFTYHVRDGWKSSEDERKERESELAEEGADTPYPGWEALADEAREEETVLFFEVRAMERDGELVARVEGEASKGLHRSTWNMRHAPYTAGGRGPLAQPGQHSLQAFVRHRSVTRALGEPQVFDLIPIGDPALPRQDRAEVLAFQDGLGELQRALQAAVAVLDEGLEQASAARETILEDVRIDRALLDQARAVELSLRAARQSLVGDSTPARRSGRTKPSIRGRLQSALYGTMGQTHGPTATHRSQAELARREYAAAEVEVRRVLEVELAGLLGALDAAGAAWTPGRPIPSLGGR